MRAAQPSIGYPGERATCCKMCRKPGMMNVKDEKCKCGFIPSFGFPGDKRATKCRDCKDAGMEDIKHKKCISGLCGGSNASANPQYKGHCRHCFIHLFPDEPVSRNYKVKENEVRNYFSTQFPSMSFVFDKTIDGGCSKRRPDIFLDLLSHVLIVEIDENQHNGYEDSCENKRIMQIYEDLAHRPIILLRFNPDSYIDAAGKAIPSPWKIIQKGLILTKEGKKDWDNRLKILNEKFQDYISVVPEKAITIEKLFFDQE